MIKHIYKYLTNPSYRFWTDFATQEENLKMYQRNLQARNLKNDNQTN